MGLLDDAIREHLELKRRHGADPSEVARQESEALGPVRRSSESSVAAEDAPEPTVEQPEDFLEEPPAFEAAEPEVFDPEPDPEPEEPEAFEPDPEPAPEPEPEAPAARRLDPDMLDQPTVEHRSARPEPPAEDEPPTGEDGDVLEATPEFLEETPEHDRLWFEQRPPRDFDFDD